MNVDKVSQTNTIGGYKIKISRNESMDVATALAANTEITHIFNEIERILGE